MRKCTGNNLQDWDFDAIFDVPCNNCGAQVEFFKDEITRYCPECQSTVVNTRKDFGCPLWCSANAAHPRNIWPKFKRSKNRFYGIFS